jgi:oligoribonuclease
MARKNSKNLVWLDLEMTGLDIKKDRIIEIATIVTDTHLNILEEGPVLAIHQSEMIINNMNEWNKKHHGASGLIDRVLESKIKDKHAEKMTLDFLKKWIVEGKSPLCGNTIWQDRRFLEKYMPELCNYFHYRQIDVSSIKELCRRWRPDLAKGKKKKNKHRALDDIRESIEELKYYRDYFFEVTGAEFAD